MVRCYDDGVNIASLFVAFAATLSSAQTPERVRLYAVDKVSDISVRSPFGRQESGEHHTAPLIIAAFAKSCPAVTFTEVQANADYTVSANSASSTLTDRKGDVVYVSPARTAKNFVKDICRYVSEHPVIH